MRTTAAEEFHALGGIEIMPMWSGFPFHRLTITRDRATIRSVFGRVWNIERNETSEVQYQRVRLILIMRTRITFTVSSGRRVPPFVPWRPRRGLAALHELQWPVRETGFLRELRDRIRM